MPKPESFVRAPSTEVQPRPELEKRTRRSFSADYKLRIIREADTCQHGEVGALLRREKLTPTSFPNGDVSWLNRVWRVCRKAPLGRPPARRQNNAVLNSWKSR